MQVIYQRKQSNPWLEISIVKEFTEHDTKFYVTVNRTSVVITRKIDFNDSSKGITFECQHTVTKAWESVLVQDLIDLIECENPHSFGCLDIIDIFIDGYNHSSKDLKCGSYRVPINTIYNILTREPLKFDANSMILFHRPRASYSDLLYDTTPYVKAI